MNTKILNRKSKRFDTNFDLIKTHIAAWSCISYYHFKGKRYRFILICLQWKVRNIGWIAKRSIPRTYDINYKLKIKTIAIFDFRGKSTTTRIPDDSWEKQFATISCEMGGYTSYDEITPIRRICRIDDFKIDLDH